jgi:hypothetical protein
LQRLRNNLNDSQPLQPDPKALGLRILRSSLSRCYTSVRYALVLQNPDFYAPIFCSSGSGFVVSDRFRFAISKGLHQPSQI